MTWPPHLACCLTHSEITVVGPGVAETLLLPDPGQDDAGRDGVLASVAKGWSFQFLCDAVPFRTRRVLFLGPPQVKS